MFGLGKKGQRLDLITVFNYLMNVYGEDEVKHFSGANSNRQEARAAHFGKENVAWIEEKKKLSITIVVKHRDKLPREAVMSLEIFKT